MLSPIGNRVLVKVEEVATTTKSGLLIIEDKKPKYRVGEVVGVGDKVMALKMGDRVMFSSYAGALFEEGVLVNVDEIYGVFV